MEHPFTDIQNIPPLFVPLVVGGTDLDPPEATTPRQLRKQRYRAWLVAEARTDYWRALIDFVSAVGRVQKIGLPEGRKHALVLLDVELDRLQLVFG